MKKSEKVINEQMTTRIKDYIRMISGRNHIPGWQLYVFYSSERNNENDNLWGFIHIFKIEEALCGNWQQLGTIIFSVMSAQHLTEPYYFGESVQIEIKT